jgi:two-component system cell cycle response regulator DivK
MSKIKILVVEDESLVAASLEYQLNALDYQVQAIARSYEEALRECAIHEPDLILMDIQLPEVSGLEVTKWIKDDATLAHIPVVAVTAFAMKGDEKRIRDGGGEAYIAKPITVTTFLATVRKLVEQQAA